MGQQYPSRKWRVGSRAGSPPLARRGHIISLLEVLPVVLFTSGSSPTTLAFAAYDLRKAPSIQYQHLADELYRLGDVVRANKSLFLIATPLTMDEVIHRVTPRFRPEDGVIIGALTSCHHLRGLPPEVTAWLARYGLLDEGDTLPMAA